MRASQIQESRAIERTRGILQNRLSRSFYSRPTVHVARELLGKKLVRLEPDGRRLSGWIVETEAYIGQTDLGCHARSGRTARNEVLWSAPGHLYVYFTYGMHWLLNLVTEGQDFPAAVLIRALVPDEGTQTMSARRRGRVKQLTDGPAKLCQALNVSGEENGIDTCQPTAQIFVQADGTQFRGPVRQGPRVGLFTVPEPWKTINWRFHIRPRSLS